jgi:hypothetical protein
MHTPLLSAQKAKNLYYQGYVLSKRPLMALLWCPSRDLQMIHGTTLRALNTCTPDEV